MTWELLLGSRVYLATPRIWSGFMGCIGQRNMVEVTLWQSRAQASRDFLHLQEHPQCFSPTYYFPTQQEEIHNKEEPQHMPALRG